ncbi:MAG: acyl-CoA dehydrogenase family protein [Candidatus Aminicenantes bacterium]|nr:acyl-CoA dehydrogenase family protein [Candidatus Aminicenantes bacterium]
MNEDLRQQKIVEQARAFASEEIRPRAAEFDESGNLPKSLIVKLAERKFLSATLPAEYGGLELDPVYYGLFLEEIGKACSSTRTLITVCNSLVGETMARWGTREQKNMWLPKIASGEKIGAFALSEPEVGSDARHVRTFYEQKGNQFVLNGRKKWISIGGIADFFIVIASGEQGITAFIVERQFKGVKTKPIRGLLACRASHVAEIEFDSPVVPEENILGKIGSGFDYIVNTALDLGRYCVAWGGVAVAQEATEAMVCYARRRSQFGKKIYNFQLIQGMIGDAVTRTHAARALCLNAGELRKNKNPQAIIETTIAKYFASMVAMEVARDAVQVHGACGCTSLYPVERLYREAKILEIIEGTSQIQQELIAKYGLRKYFRNVEQK